MEEYTVVIDAPFANIHNTADWHLENLFSEESEVEKMLDIVAKDPHGRLNGLGDFGDFIIVKDRRMDLATRAFKYQKPKDLERRIRELFERVKDKTDVIIPGNHENVISRSYGNMIGDIAKILGIKYGGGSCLITYKMPKGEFKLFIAHGNGSHNSRQRCPRRRELALCDWVRASTINKAIADCYLVGHVHRLAFFEPVYEKRMYLENGKEKFNDVLIEPAFGVVGQFLKPYESRTSPGASFPGTSYVENSLYDPQPTGFLTITINEYGKIISHEKHYFN